MSQDLEQRIADLERRVKELEAQPREQHFHYHQPVYPPNVPPPAVPDEMPYTQKIYIGDPPSTWPNVTTWMPNTTGTVTWPDGFFRSC